MARLKSKFTNTQLIVLSFLSIVLLGTFLLSLPAASRTGKSAGFVPSLFTATSATCVTGLTVYDTYTGWSLFGQLVILSLIQIGGLGFMSFITLFSVFLKKKISLSERKLLMQSAGSMQIGGIVKLLYKIFIGTVIFEVLGAVALSFRFVPLMGWGEGIYNAIFHSISAFCNAGFDIMGKYGEFSSFSSPLLKTDLTVNLTLIFLIVTGGLGFIVWNDILKNKFNFKKYELHSKIVLVATAVLLLGGSILFFVFEYGHSLSGLSIGEKILASFFHSAAPRTAGMNTLDMNEFSPSGNLLTMILMLIGGNPGSTAGGIKTTTVFVLLLGVIAAARHTDTICVFKRKIDDSFLKQASAVFVIYILAILASVMTVCAIEGLPLDKVTFEVISAIATVGHTSGIIPSLGDVSRVILIVLMFSGRVGALSLMLFLAEKRKQIPVDRPDGKVIIG